ncbi:hypothetical protein ACFYT4_16680 [Streptomyces sp. NPDC004609]|uniref:hypothetical protein n=1 Tax=Streptomyces sp. NPDC004609 TaxID=3364704 RepID=UPI0036AE6AF5
MSLRTATAWAAWYQRTEAAGEDPALANRLMNTTAGLRQHSWQIEQIRNQAAAPPPALSTRAAPTPPSPGTTASPRR